MIAKYFITVLSNINDIRCWGYVTSFQRAHEIVLSNETDIFENGCYKYAIIEKIGKGTNPDVEGEQWYEYNRDTVPTYVVTIEKPKEFEGYCNFSIG